MRSAKAVVLLAAWTCVPLFASGSTFSGGSALKYTDAAVKFGPRPSGSLANRKLQGYIKTQLTRWGVPYTTDAFVANTPAGPKPMMNIVAKIKGTSGRGVVVSGHYDTKIMPMVTFVGANDAGSSTGLLLELARTQAGKPRKDDLYIVWFDGEEAVATWTANDSLYGSRHLATKWLTDGTSKTIKALINVDMIGDANLGLVQEYNSTGWLQKLVWQAAQESGFAKALSLAGGAIEDDHIPFLRIGVPSVDLIDFDFGPNNSYWHTAQDTMDKLSAQSLETVGSLVVKTLEKLESVQ